MRIGTEVRKVVRSTRTIALVLLVAALMESCSTAPPVWPPPRRSRPEPRSVRVYLTNLTGPDFRDCGSYGLADGWNETRGAAFSCAMEAIAERRPFYFREIGPIAIDFMDVPQSRGLVGTSNGRILLYRYSGSCDDVSCRVAFKTQPCPIPKLSIPGTLSFPFGCEPESEP
jgi:hypothetical protein